MDMGFVDIVTTNYCRACLATADTEMTLISSLIEVESMRLLLDFLNLEVLENEYFPKRICSPCVNILKETIKFKENCESSFRYLQNINKTLKNELKKDGNESNISEDNATYDDFNQITLWSSDDDIPIKEYISDKEENENSIELKTRCEQCNKCFKNETLYQYHKIIYHSTVRPFKCPECSHTSYNKTSMANHLRIHSNEKPFCCNICPKTFTQKSILNRHIKIHTSKPNSTYDCLKCDKKFKSPKYLKNHEKGVHDQQSIPKQQCKVCGKSMNNLTEHMKNHSSEEVTCKYCGNVYKSKYTLQNHIKDIHEKPQECYRELCSFCGRAFRFKSDLKIHVKFKHTDERTVQCEYCDMKFKTKSYYRRHERNIHFNKRNFKCNLCTKAFNSKDILVRHLRVHTGERPFACKFCAKTFTHAATVYKHTKLLHGKPV